AGNSGIIGEGDVQWMTAASGVLHKEYHEKEFSRTGGTFHMAQLWVNLPAKHKMEAPRYQAIKAGDMPEVQLPDGRSTAHILAGETFGAKGPAKTWSPIIAAVIKLGAGGKADFELPAGFNSTILVVKGDAVINGAAAPVDNLVILANDGTGVEATSANGAMLLVLSGEPLNEPIVAYGPFVMNTVEEIRQAMLDVQAGKFGVLED
ncbi:MAG TPA: pirin-like C-terminal cupin domain-containing protein, partial [Flavobacteriales bacterium]|nr:pirin-like C-terminal cupin domain-containing protein [Flavobacteriales bacterium]